MVKKKIIFIANSAWYLYNFRKKHIEKLVNQNYDVYFFAPRDEYVEDLEKTGGTFFNWNLKRESQNIFAELYALFDLLFFLTSNNHATFYTFTPKANIYTGLVSNFLNIEFYANVSGLGYTQEKRSFMNKLIINLYRFSISNAKHIFFQNEEDLTSFLKMKLAKKIQSSVLPGSGVDIQFFRNSNTKIFHKEKNTFLMVTRLLRSKGVCDFLDVAKEFNDKGIPGKFLLVGREELSHPDGILQEEIKNKYTLSNTEFVWNERNVKKFYEISHYCVFPTRYNEGTPKTLLEASAMGCIPVCYRNKGFKEFIRDKVNGFYSLENKESLFKKMNEIILMDSDELQSISSEAKKTVKLKFSDDLVIDKYNELLD